MDIFWIEDLREKKVWKLLVIWSWSTYFAVVFPAADNSSMHSVCVYRRSNCWEIEK